MSAIKVKHRASQNIVLSVRTMIPDKSPKRSNYVVQCPSPCSTLISVYARAPLEILETLKNPGYSITYQSSAVVTAPKRTQLRS
jgi:hypothetical protein